MVKKNHGKVWSYNVKFENSQENDVTFEGEELFNIIKGVILLKQFYTNMTFTLTTYLLRIQVLIPFTVSLLRFG